MPSSVTIDLVTYDPKRDAHILIAVEQGPWPNNETDSSLRRLQDRLYDYVDVAVDGLLATRYPESKGKSVIIRLNCYAIPHDEVEQFFYRFAEFIHSSREIQAAIATHQHIKDLEFEFNWHPNFN